MVKSMRAEIEIDAPPKQVRKVFFDFERIPEWHNGDNAFLKSISARSKRPAKPPQKGDILTIKLPGFTIKPPVLVSTDEEFTWGGNYYVLGGEHRFFFRKNEETGGTTFIQDEEVFGILTWIFYPGSRMYEDTVAKYEKFGRDLKARCEEGKK